MKKVLIIEDEEISARYLTKMINEIDPSLEVTGPMTSIEDIICELERTNNYYIIFSDIRLNGRLVFEAFEKVRPKSTVIFTTAYDEYALSAFKNMGIEYLLKPIDFEELKSAIEKVNNLGSMYFDSSSSYEQRQFLSESYKKHLLVTKDDNLIPIKTEEICYIKREEYVRVFLFDGSNYALSHNLVEMESMLDPRMFFRLNRQYIANINSILRISNFFNYKLTVKLKGCKDIVVVSKERATEFKKWIEK